tara:strand:- start:2906 stop:4972 length:2067 start_codon:yes stop_codon:yes gene_type:complete
MAKTNTDLGINVALENAPTPKPVMNVGQEKIVGKDPFGALSASLAKINPTIKKLADQNLKDQADKDFEQGKAEINGMTLDEAREAHKKGFPDIFNGWARYGAYKQYAVNSVEDFNAQFKNDYYAQRNEAGYNWQDHYNQESEKYLVDKAGDEFFTSAYNEGTAKLRQWLNVQEFEKQQDDLSYKVFGNATLSLQTLPNKVEEQLEIDFYTDELANDPEGMNTNNYKERKAEFFRKNMSKYFKNMFYDMKENRNPALSLKDFDEILINSAEQHAKLDGRFSREYIELLTSNRPDGTPSVLNSKEYRQRVEKLIGTLTDAITLNNNGASWFIGNVGSMSKADRTQLGTDLFNKEYRIKKSEGRSDADAFVATTLTLMPGLKRNEPVKPILDLLSKPLTREYTEDNKLALEVYAALEKNGITGIYFEENDKNKFKYYVANLRIQAGEDPRDVIKSMGSMDTTTQEINDLTSSDKQKIQLFSSANMANANNQELAYMTAKYFKNIVGGVESDYIKLTEKFLEEHYEVVNDRYISKYKLNAFGVTKDNYDAFKVTAIEVLKDKLNTEKNIIQETDIVGFFYDETNIDVDGTPPNKTEGIDIDKYELIVDTNDDVVYFKEDDGSPLEVPATVEYKDGQTVWLQLPLKLVKDTFADKVKRQEEEQAVKDLEAFEKKRLRKEKMQRIFDETKDRVP